jgi:two-component system, LytTR family, sensor kinase
LIVLFYNGTFCPFIHTFKQLVGTRQGFNFIYLPLQSVKHNKITPFIPHIAGWTFFFSLVLGFLYRTPETTNTFNIIFSGTFLLFCAIYLFLFYFNSYVLIPKLYLEKKFVLYALIILILFALVYMVKPFDMLMSEFNRPPNGPVRPPPGMELRPRMDRPPGGMRKERHTDIVSIILFITVWSLSTAICIIRQWRNTERRMMLAEADKANAELSFLKAQINPHFLFNTLNNIYSLANAKSENTAASILKLSNIMRYVTDEVKEEFVPLEDEVAFISDYLDLQRLRLGNKMNIGFLVSGKIAEKKIAPLILMTFIENVFKYGISSHSPSAIDIQLSAAENSIRFFCSNKLYENLRPVESTGIGINNTRKRLEHLYPGRFELNIDKKNGMFSVQLTLKV